MNHQMNYPAGATILEEGEKGECAYIIDKGVVEISASHGSEKIVLAVLTDGDIFGEMALVSGDVRSASARALVETTVSVICRAYFEEKLSQTDPIIAMLMKLLLARFHEARGKLLSMPKVCLNRIDTVSRVGEPLAKREERLETVRRFRFINDLQSALARQQFVLHYQPIFVLATGRLAGFEALVRWNHPHQGMIPPNLFIGIAEDTKDIVSIGYWVFETACADLKKLRDALGVGRDSLEPWMSVNVSPIQFKDADLPDRFGEILSRCDATPHAIKIELTESVLVQNPELALLFICEMRRLGMKVAIDDFGTGYSSLSYLHLFPIDILKIDRSFVDNIMSDIRSREIVNAIIALSKSLNIDIVAEGVETKELEALLLELGCRYGQGFLYSRPLAFEQAIKLMENGSKAAIG
jgi:EAL domain-containing protein (putative c-di-GMP-specific phosphodiesterase class I)